MSTETSEGSSTDWKTIAWVTASSHRREVLLELTENAATPSTLTERVTIDDMSHVSRALNQLRDRGLVELLVPEEVRKGRIYDVTDKGYDIAMQTEEVDA